ncbi:hypothetical protein KUCAC02_017712, partial [Chaenocephalus aceratus]
DLTCQDVLNRLDTLEEDIISSGAGLIILDSVASVYVDSHQRQILIAKSPVAPFAVLNYTIEKQGICMDGDDSQETLYEGTDPGLQPIRDPKWVSNFPIADGPRQSPIDILPGGASYDSGLKPLSLKYDPSNCLEILNNGHSFQVTFADDSDSSTLKEGPISGVYRLKQFHFHWGASNDKGSEHTVAGTKYPAEIGDANAVSRRFSTPSMTSGPKASRPLSLTFDPSYLAALVALTTGHMTAPYPPPPLLESVTWIVCKEPISVSCEQMAKFRSLLSLLRI